MKHVKCILARTVFVRSLVPISTGVPTFCGQCRMLSARMIVSFLLVVVGTFVSYGQWKEVRSIYGGNVDEFAKVGKTIVATGRFSGVFITRNEGSTWTHLSIDGHYQSERLRGGVSSNGKKLYLADYWGGVFVTTDECSTWTTLPRPGGDYAYPTAVDALDSVTLVGWLSPAGTGIVARSSDDFGSFTESRTFSGQVVAITGNSEWLFACTLDSVFVSTDQGRSWIPTRVSPPATAGLFVDMISQDSVVVLGANGGVFISTNAGSSWTSAVGPTDAMCLSLNGSYWSAGSGGIWTSDDAGLTWKQTGEVATIESYGKITHFDIRSVFASDGLVFCSTRGPGIFKSTNNGASWELANRGFTVPEICSMAESGDSLFAAAYGIGVFRTYDLGQTWNSSFRGMEDSRLYSIAAHENVVFVGSRTVVSVSSDGGVTWTTCKNAPAGVAFCMVFIGRTLYAAFNSDDEGFVGIYRTDDRGQTWLPLGKGGLPTGLQVRVSGMAFKDSCLFAGLMNEGVFVTTDDGVTWEKRSASFTDPLHPYAWLMDIRSDGKRVYALAQNWLLMSQDNGITWENIGIEKGYPDTVGHDKMTIHGTNLFVTFRGRVYHSANYGRTWTSVGEGMNLTIAGTGPGSRTLVSTRRQIFGRSQGGNPLWERNLSDFALSTECTITPRSITVEPTHIGERRYALVIIKNAGIDTLKIAGIDTDIPEFASSVEVAEIAPGGTLVDTIRFEPKSIRSYATHAIIRSNSLSSPDTVRISTSGITATEAEHLPVAFLIDQNYPNPFNPSTTIRYGLPSRALVSVTVFNPLGQQVAILQNDVQDAGYYHITFDGANLSSGMYFYRIRAGSFTETKKLLLVR
jgi:photosystem II stability/assembly factor-like uncharacterized protein